MPTEIRAAGLACGYFVFNAVAVLLAQITPLAVAAISWRFFLIFLGMDCIYLIIVLIFYPETQNVVLERVGERFGDPVIDIKECLGREKCYESETVQPKSLEER